MRQGLYSSGQSTTPMPVSIPDMSLIVASATAAPVLGQGVV